MATPGYAAPSKLTVAAGYFRDLAGLPNLQERVIRAHTHKHEHLLGGHQVQYISLVRARAAPCMKQLCPWRISSFYTKTSSTSAPLLSHISHSGPELALGSDHAVHASLLCPSPDLSYATDCCDCIHQLSLSLAKGTIHPLLHLLYMGKHVLEGCWRAGTPRRQSS